MIKEFINEVNKISPNINFEYILIDISVDLSNIDSKTYKIFIPIIKEEGFIRGIILWYDRITQYVRVDQDYFYNNQINDSSFYSFKKFSCREDLVKHLENLLYLG